MRFRMNRVNIIGILASTLVVFCNYCYANNVDLADMDIEALLNMEVSVASYNAKPIRQQPGVISVITRSEIENIGARDLMDILNLVAGFRPVSEEHETVTLTARGIYATEGKILLVLDGIAMNEILFGLFHLGNHFPADMIEQVEIIRGPGSAMYGGSAEVAVIKITSRGEMNQTDLFTTVSVNSGEVSFRNSIQHSQSNEQWGFSVYASRFHGNRSNEDHTSIYGNTHSMETMSETEPEFYNIGFRYDKFKLRAVHDSYEYDYVDRYGSNYGQRHAIFDSTAISALYDIDINDRFKITPKFVYKYHNPWRYETLKGTEKNIDAERFKYSLLGNYVLPNEHDLSFGIDHYMDNGQAHPSDANKDTGIPKYDYTEYFDGNESVKHYNTSIFAQYECPTSIGDLVIGGRFEDHSFAGQDFVPRFALTKVFDKFHFKVLGAQAFHAPFIENINYAQREGVTLSAEKTTTFEGEIGYQFTDDLYWTTNIFHAKIDDTIYFDASDSTYINGESVASYGIETEIRFVPTWGDVKIRYAWYQADLAGVPLWDTDKGNQTAAMPNHQISADITHHLSATDTINLNGFVTNSFRGNDYNAAEVDSLSDDDTDEEAFAKLYDVNEHFDPAFIFTLYYKKKINNLTLGAGISDIFNEKERLTSYKGYQSPLEQMGREFYVTLHLIF